MSRDGSGTYSLPSNTLAVSGDAISSTKYNSLVQDLEADANVDRPIAAGGTGASTASAARTNLGLVIGTDVQAFDAALLSIAGLTTAADRSIYTTASDTYAVYTLTAAGRAILDDADASAQRTTLGLAIGTDVQAFDQQLLDIAALAVTDSGFIVGNGTTFVLETGSTAQTSLGYTAADVLTKLLTVDGAGSGLDADLLDGYNVGTSGATIPLLNAANTFGAAQAFSTDIIWSGNIAGPSTTFAGTFGANPTASILTGGYVQVWASGSANPGRTAIGNAAQTLVLDGAAGFTYNSNTVWHAGNDGAGSGLDADTLDGVQGSAYAALAGTQTVTGLKTFTASADPPSDGSTAIVASGNFGGGIRFVDGSKQGTIFVSSSGDNLHFSIGTNVSAAASSAQMTLTPSELTLGVTLKTRISASTETTGTLTVASANETIQATGDITIPNAVFSAGDIILIYAGASSRTITQGASVTMRLGGTATTGSRTLAARGVAMLFFISSSEVVVSGDVT